MAAVSSSAKQRCNRRSTQSSSRRGTDPGPRSLDNDTPWYGQDVTESLYAGGPSLSVNPNFADLVRPFPGLDHSGAIADNSFNCWDPNLQPFQRTSLSSLAAPSTIDVAPNWVAPSTTGGREDSEDPEGETDPTDALSLQLASLSQRAARATRRLFRIGRPPLTVSSPEVNEALEDTNNLIRIMTSISRPTLDGADIDLKTTDYGLVFSALACHQHLLSLFRAICDAINRYLQSTKEQQQRDDSNQLHSDIAASSASSVAQSVMVLQLLIHLTNRMDRTFFQDRSLMWRGAQLSITGLQTPITPNTNTLREKDPTESQESTRHESTQIGLLSFVQNIVRTIPDEHEKLREVIQKLQVDIERPELY